jgi:hypothetical protein
MNKFTFFLKPQTKVVPPFMKLAPKESLKNIAELINAKFVGKPEFKISNLLM